MDRRADLERVREVLFMALDGDRLLQRQARAGEQTSFAESAAGLARELRAVVKELDALAVPDEEGNVADDLLARRKARLAGADDSALTSRRGQSRRRGRSNPAS